MEAFVLRYQSDSAHPQDIVPIYLVHSMERPFCQVPSCWCHTDQGKVVTLLESIQSGVMILHEATDFVKGECI
jgi:hypothetical protein